MGRISELETEVQNKRSELESASNTITELQTQLTNNEKEEIDWEKRWAGAFDTKIIKKKLIVSNLTNNEKEEIDWEKRWAGAFDTKIIKKKLIVSNLTNNEKEEIDWE